MPGRLLGGVGPQHPVHRVPLLARARGVDEARSCQNVERTARELRRCARRPAICRARDPALIRVRLRIADLPDPAVGSRAVLACPPTTRAALATMPPTAPTPRRTSPSTFKIHDHRNPLNSGGCGDCYPAALCGSRQGLAVRLVLGTCEAESRDAMTRCSG